MSSIRPSLLADQRDQDDWRRGLALVLFCLLLSVWIHLAGFIAWQYLDKNAAGNFVFELQPENPVMELTLVFNEPLEIQSETGAGEGQARSGAAEASPAPAADGEPALTAMAADVPEVNGAVAGGEIQARDENPADPAAANPEPPISVEGEAPERKSYYTAIRMAVNNRWIVPPAAKNNFRPSRLTVDFIIGRNGELLRWVTVMGTGNSVLDHAAQEAIRSAAPFPPFPDDLKQFSQLEIRMHFDYKAQSQPRPLKP